MILFTFHFLRSTNQRVHYFIQSFSPVLHSFCQSHTLRWASTRFVSAVQSGCFVSCYRQFTDKPRGGNVLCLQRRGNVRIGELSGEEMWGEMSTSRPSNQRRTHTNRRQKKPQMNESALMFLKCVRSSTDCRHSAYIAEQAKCRFCSRDRNWRWEALLIHHFRLTGRLQMEKKRKGWRHKDAFAKTSNHLEASTIY